MSEQDLRKILNDVIADLDSGRALPPRRGRLARLGVGVGAPAALALGLALGGCEEPRAAYGVPPTDAAQHLDGSCCPEYGAPLYAGPDARLDGNLDDGAVIEYGGPDLDGSLDGRVDGTLDASMDDGAVVDYGVPQVDGGDGGN